MVGFDWIGFKVKKTVDKMSVDEMSVDEMSVDEMSVDEMSVDEMSVDEMSVDEMYVDKLACFNKKLKSESARFKSHNWLQLMLYSCHIK